MALVMLALPGAAFVYNAEELGLPNVDLPDEVLQDPVWERSGHEERGRDGCRVPMPWSGAAPPFGFSTSSDTWLPMPSDWSRLTVEAQDGAEGSTLTLFRRAIELRHGRGILGERIEWLDAQDGALAFRGSDGLVCVLNAGTRPVPVPDGELLIASQALVDGKLPPDGAAWIA
jgi:alpha-glucosidase